MRQQSLTDGFEKHRKERFLEEMDQIIPWQRLADAIRPHSPAPKGAGRRPVGLERMLRIYFLQHWFNLSDPAAEEAIYDSRAMRRFVGIDLGHETTICKFRHLMERHQFGDQLLQLINDYLHENGLSVARGTIVDASIIQAPSSTKNKDLAGNCDLLNTKPFIGRLIRVSLTQVSHRRAEMDFQIAGSFNSSIDQSHYHLYNWRLNA